ncbi:putative leucine-rich repeat transmembrane protein kinase [Capsicum annuum]|nr:putative leucine-rich repeat transmembrane protein kinase [Capsicum annuum]
MAGGGGADCCMRLAKEHLSCWHSKSELKAEVLCGIKEIGSVLYWMGLLDIVLTFHHMESPLSSKRLVKSPTSEKEWREVDTRHFMQTAPWLGLIPGADGQILHSQEEGDSPMVTLFKSATTATMSDPNCTSPTSFHTISRQAEAAGQFSAEELCFGYAEDFMKLQQTEERVLRLEMQRHHHPYTMRSKVQQVSSGKSYDIAASSMASGSVSWEYTKSYFKFQAWWLEAEGFNDKIKDWWGSFEIVGRPDFILAAKLIALKTKVEEWNSNLLYKANINTGSVLEYALAFTSAALDKYCSKWSTAPKTGFIDITTSKDFYRIFSGLQIEYLEESVQLQSNTYEMLGDSVAWGGCTIIYLLGQQLHFELFDFSHQVLNVAEVESVAISPTQKNPNFLQQSSVESGDRESGETASGMEKEGIEGLLEAMKKARRLNNHVFSMLKARCPLEDKQACAIKQSGAPLHRAKFENTVSAFETLPQKGA